MAAMAAVLDAVILIPRPGQLVHLPPGTPAVDLDVQQARLIPLTDAVKAACQCSDGDLATVEGFYELSTGVARSAREMSDEWAVLYVYCEFFGGEGIHAAIAWDCQRVVFGPLFTRTAGHPAEPRYRPADRPGMAINVALRALGIHGENGRDEFDTLGLARHRWTSDWLT
jgi:hypothetical protein